MLQLLGLWAIVTFVFLLNALALNVALSALFFFLTLTFALLSAGEGNLAAEKVRIMLPLPSLRSFMRALLNK